MFCKKSFLLAYRYLYELTQHKKYRYRYYLELIYYLIYPNLWGICIGPTTVHSSDVHPNTLNLDLDPDLELYYRYQFLKKKKKNLRKNNFF